MIYKYKLKCINEVDASREACKECDCRHWINYEKDLNCIHIAIDKHGPLKLQEIGDRLQVTAARIKQLEQQVLEKLSKSKTTLKILQ